MALIDLTLPQLLAAFRAPHPTPGGGSAAALAGAVGASLLSMVAGLAKPRASTAEDVERLAAAGARCEAIADGLTALIDRDAEAYDTVVEAFRLPKGTDDEKGARAARIQQAMTAATEAPLEVMRACGEAVEQGAVVAAFGNPKAASDLQVGLELLATGLRGALLNVETNLGSLKDGEYVAKVREEAGRLVTECERGVVAARARLAEPA